ncbi:hypothetical protein LguiA_029027 [Lonicera macranthoides]
MAAQLHITLIFFILASLTSLTTSTPSSEFSILDRANDFLSKENMSELFGLWKQKHGKVYKHAQEAEKRIIHTRQNSYMAKVVEIIPAQFQIDDNWNGKSGYIQVPFQVLIQRQIARLLDPSLECARFIYNELVKMSNCCMVSELQRFPFLRNRKDEIVENFLQEVLEPAETTIGHIVEMEVKYRLRTLDRLNRWGTVSDDMSVLCGGESECKDHLFFNLGHKTLTPEEVSKASMKKYLRLLACAPKSEIHLF